ncbi:MAG: hypothetical protein LH654_02310, partial [Thermoleophilia bacterium]|nr:hypothetical protein [Thermoleophilia bacterium]
MRRTKVRMLFASIAALALMVGVGSAIAANGSDGKDLKQAAAQISGRESFETAVAKNLGTTKAKLNAAFSSAAKAQATARVDQALKDGKITEVQATEMKAKIAEATFPGFGAGGPGHGPGGHGGPGGPGGGGMGFGPPPGYRPPADRSSSGAAP